VKRDSANKFADVKTVKEGVYYLKREGGVYVPFDIAHQVLNRLKLDKKKWDVYWELTDSGEILLMV
jgi:hypothetical protein